MNRGRISTQVFLCFLMMMFLLVTVGCSSKDDDPIPATTYSISGAVTGDILAGVTINLTGAATATTTTAADGTYSFTGRANGTYTVTPVLADYTFDPTSTAVTVNGSNMTANFVATHDTAAKYTISGAVTGVANVTLNLTGDSSGSITTGASGATYTISNLPAGNYTVTPYLSGYSFDPTHRHVTLTTLDSVANNFTATAQNFTQADLEGTWDARMLVTGDDSGWMRGTATADSDGNITFTSCFYNAGAVDCPKGPIVWTIDETTGVIDETDNGSETDSHYTMASNKTFIAGTQNQGPTERALLIAQKKKDGTVYEDANLYNKSFVFHQLFVGNYTGAAGWSYGAGSTNGSGLATSSSETNSWGSASSGSPGTLLVDPTGVVTISGDTSWNGFLSADKRTIVGVSTSDHGGGDYSYTLMIIQVTTGQSSSVSSIVGTSYLHMLAAGDDPAPFWAHQPIYVTSAGLMTLGLWECSNASEDRTGTATLSISSSGTATVVPSGGTSDFHGQLSYDGTFMIGVETYDTGAFALDVFTYSNDSPEPL